MRLVLLAAAPLTLPACERATGEARDVMDPKESPPTRIETPPPPDERIHAAVQRELLYDRAVALHRVDAETREGIVTLTGSVRDLLAKERAVELAEGIRGVRAVLDRLVVDKSDRTDAELERDVEAALVADPAADAAEIEVEVEAGRVRLSGAVDSLEEKRLTEQVAKGVRGALAVQSEVEVRPAERRPDAELLAEVRRRLETDARIDPARIQVEVKDGVVTLRGAVGSVAERRQAYWDAHVAGARSVVHEALEVEPFARNAMRRKRAVVKSDEQLAAAIEAAFRHDPRAPELSVEAHVEGGVATLTGEVESLAAKWAAAEDARNTVGIWRVVNLLRVRPRPPVTDDQAERQLREALLRSARLGAATLSVSVVDGVAHIDGSVGSAFDKELASEIASRVRGVLEVENRLDVARELRELPDWEIRDNIRSEFEFHPFIDPSAIEVSVEDGVATLKGTVFDWKTYGAAIDNAREAGARRVVPKLLVEGGPDFLKPGVGP